jgi:hypothetical protein
VVAHRLLDRVRPMTRRTRIFPELRSVGAGGARAHADRLLHMPLWCPHAPLALALAISGLTQLLLTSRSLRHLIAWPSSGKVIVPVAGGLHMPRSAGYRKIPSADCCS